MKIVAWCKEDDARLTDDLPGPLACPDCKKVYPLRGTEVPATGKLVPCLMCGYEHYHLRKDFPRVLGIVIVAVAFFVGVSGRVVPPQLFFLPLIVASAFDFLLYLVLPWKIVCYVCEAEYHGTSIDPSLKQYDLHVATECKRLRWPKPA